MVTHKQGRVNRGAIFRRVFRSKVGRNCSGSWITPAFVLVLHQLPMRLRTMPLDNRRSRFIATRLK
jgi:hypothetical protein